MTVYIKNMVCGRCKMMVRDVLATLGLAWTRIELGEVEIMGDLSVEEHNKLRAALLKTGLELIDDKKGVLVERIKKVIVEQVHYTEDDLRLNLSAYVSRQLGLSYTYISNTFSEVQGITIEQFYIRHKIERIKELIGYNELTLTEIASKMHYCSVSHLSSQFKKVTGQPPSYFRNVRNNGRLMLEDI